MPFSFWKSWTMLQISSRVTFEKAERSTNSLIPIPPALTRSTVPEKAPTPARPSSASAPSRGCPKAEPC
jgi:hypothetical protein